MICQECMKEGIWLYVYDKQPECGYCNNCMAPHCMRCGFSHKFSLKGHVCPVGPLMKDKDLEERE